MRRPVLVDTSALVALYMASDARHREASSVLAGLREKKRPLLATTDVFDETVTLVRRWAGYARAIEAGESLRQSRVLELVNVEDDDREEAWDLFRRHKEAKLSFTDCTSAAIMGRLEIEEVFTFDSDFRGFGFKTVPDENRGA
jgi:predicted nucleic acid-binding protein